MALLPCEVTEGPRPGYKAVGVTDMLGQHEYLSIEERFLVNGEDRYFLSVRLIGRDVRQNTALVQLPVEADSGANRMWVLGEQLTDAVDEVRT